MEQLKVYRNKKHKTRNRAEFLMVNYIQEEFANPTKMTITQAREWCLGVANGIEKSKGGVTFSEIHVNGQIMGEEHKQTRQFAMYGRGRGTYTVCVYETIFKDANNGYCVADCLFNEINLKQQQHDISSNRPDNSH